MRHCFDQGFTLLELLLSLTILSLAMLLLIPSIASMLSSSKKFSDKLIVIAQKNKFEALLNKNLSSALSIKVDYDNHEGTYFVGKPTTVKYLFPGNNGPEKRTIEKGRSQSIIFSRGIFKDEIASFKNYEFKFSYFGKMEPREQKRWHKTWLGKKNLPELIRFSNESDAPVIIKIWGGKK